MVPGVAGYDDGAIGWNFVESVFHVARVDVMGAFDVSLVPFACLAHVEHEQVIAAVESVFQLLYCKETEVVHRPSLFIP